MPAVDLNALLADHPKPLTELALTGITEPLDLAPLARLDALEVLDLRGSTGITDVSALDDVESLRAILLRGSGVTRRAVDSELRWRCTWVTNPNLERMRAQAPPTRARSAMAPVEKISLAKLKKMLKTGDMDTIDQALEILTTLGDASYFDALLDGADYDRVSRWKLLGRWAWRVGSSKYSGVTLQYVVHGLIAGAAALPAGSESAVARSLRERVGELDFVEPSKRRPRPQHPFDLLHLEALPNLKKLGFYHFGPFKQRERAPALPALERFEIHGPNGDVSLAWLANSPALSALKLVGLRAPRWDADLSFLAGLPITSLELENCDVVDLSALDGLQQLETLRVKGCNALAQLGSLANLPALKSLHIEACSRLTSLDGLGGLPALEQVALPLAYGMDASAIERLPALARAELSKRLVVDADALAARGVAVERVR